MRRALTLVLIALSLSACVGAKVTKSDFDGSTHINTKYGWCENGAVNLTLAWNSKMPADRIRLDAAVDGGVMAGGDSLHFNIDGKLFDLRAAGHPTLVPYGSQSLIEDSYQITPELVDAIVSGSKVIPRLDLTKDYIEGTLRDDPSGAIYNFREFMVAFRQETSH